MSLSLEKLRMTSVVHLRRETGCLLPCRRVLYDIETAISYPYVVRDQGEFATGSNSSIQAIPTGLGVRIRTYRDVK